MKTLTVDATEHRAGTAATPGFLDLIPAVLLTVVALLYYASYFRYGFGWADEGSVALIAERLAAGERPYLDVDPGYGILWYYPIAGLYKLFGVQFSVVRAYFIALGFAAACISYPLLRRLTGNRRVALATALLVLIFPGSGYKTYIPLLVICGAYVTLLYESPTGKSSVSPAAAAANGCFLGIAFLIRADIATVFVFLFLTYQVLLAWRLALLASSKDAVRQAARRIASVLLVGAVVTLPFAIFAYWDGFSEQFTRQYYRPALDLVTKVYARFIPVSSSLSAPAGTLLPRARLWPIGNIEQAKAMFLTYGPLLVLACVGALLVIEGLAAHGRREKLARFLANRTSLVVLAVAAFAAFPQFFVFRPDLYHLSEFAPGLIVMIAYFLYLLKGLVEDAAVRPPISAVAYIGITLCLAYGVVYAMSYRTEGLGLRRGAVYRLHVPPRLDAYVPAYPYELLNWLNTTVRQYSKPEDYVLCFPYCPGVNYITERRTFQKFLYVDDSFPHSHPEWMATMRKQIMDRKPRVIIVWNWAINGTRVSQFQNWAEPLYQFIADSYERKAFRFGYEIFVSK